MADIQTRFVTKYALTTGIIKAEGEISKSYFYFPLSVSFGARAQAGPNDHFETIEDARARAVELRDRKIASLEKQRGKLQRLTFETVVEEK